MKSCVNRVLLAVRSLINMYSVLSYVVRVQCTIVRGVQCTFNRTESPRLAIC